VNARSARRWLFAAGVAALAGAGWAVFGSAATLTVAPRNHSAFRTCVLTAYSTNSSVSFDAWVDQAAPNSNNGGKATVQLESRSGRNRRAYIRFDLAKCNPAVAASSTVETATLRLSLATAPAASRTYNIYRVTGPCPEAATTCWTQNSLVWNNQPTVAAAATSTLALTSSSATNRYYTFDVTADAVAMVAGTASNYGWRIADSAEGNATAITAAFEAENATSNASGAPQLVIVYSP
jgi:hypothetical protein